jgi:hypothetical protein
MSPITPSAKKQILCDSALAWLNLTEEQFA